MRTERIGDATLILGDCREVLPTVEHVDAVVTDPPYGVNYNYAAYDDARDEHQGKCSVWLAAMRECSPKVLIFTGTKNLWLWERPDWLACWHKSFSVGRSPFGFNNWEPIAVYGKPGLNERQSDWFEATFERIAETGHPCPKPVGAMVGAITIASKAGDVICDPFMGSGTTGVACARLGRRFVGIEIHEPYFDIACRRIEAAYRQRDLFIPAPAPVPPEDARCMDLFREPEAAE